MPNRPLWIKSVNPTKNRGKITMPNQPIWIKSLNQTKNEAKLLCQINNYG